MFLPTPPTYYFSLVNDIDFGPIINNLPAVPLHPIVVFDGANRVVRQIGSSESAQFVYHPDDIKIAGGKLCYSIVLSKLTIILFYLYLI